jgi:pimeloyl-ACP methyl ester carboxylesterase
VPDTDDEFALLADNAGEVGLDWLGAPAVARREVPLPEGGRLSALKWGDAPPEAVERTIRHNPGRSASSLRRGVVHNAHELDDGSWAWRWDPERRMGRLGVDSSADFARLWDDVSTLSVPLTLVRGGRSPVVDEADVAELLARRPGAEVVVVDDAGHSVQGDQPLELAAILTARMATRP